MGIFDFIKGELLEIVEWTDDSRDILSWRFPDEDKAIKHGAALIVRESQVAQFVYLGEFGDTFGPGKHSLVTDNIPVLTRLKSWRYGLESPFKADIYFLNTRLFSGNKWGTSNPIMMRDDDFGVVRARAFGTYDFRITNAPLFLKEVAGSDHTFRLDEFAGTMRSRLVSVFSEALANSRIPVLDAAAQYSKLGEALLPLINPVMAAKYGMEIATFVVENVSVPAEVEEAIDKRSGMAAVGDLNEYVKYQMGAGMEKGGSAGGMATEMAIGMAIAQQMVQQVGLPGDAPGARLPGGGSGSAGAAVGDPVGPGAAGAGAGGAFPGSAELMTPAEVGQMLGVPESDVLAIVESGELASKRIGTSIRIKRSAVHSYLAD